MTSFYQDADIPFMLADFGVPVTLEDVTAPGLVDYIDSAVLREMGVGGVMNKAITVMVQTSRFPCLATEVSNAIGLPITVDGVRYIIRRREQTTDGAITHLLVSG